MKEKKVKILERLSEENKSLRENIDELNRKIEDIRTRADVKTERSHFVSLWLRYPFLLIALIGIVVFCGFEVSLDMEEVVIAIVPASIIFMIWLYLGCQVGRSKPHISDWKWFKRIDTVKIWLGRVALAFFINVCVDAYWDTISDHFAKNTNPNNQRVQASVCTRQP